MWNAAERSETRVNARVARELRPALPAELPLDEQRRLVHGFGLFLKDRYGVAVHYVIHAPNFHDAKDKRKYWQARKSREGWQSYLADLADPAQTNLNFHAHIRFTTRSVDRGTGSFGAKTRVLDARETGPDEVVALRAEWEKRTNAALKKIGAQALIDLRSYEAMATAGEVPEGLEPQEHLGPKRSARRRAEVQGAAPIGAEGRNAARGRRNEDRWMHWLELRAMSREKARLERLSAQIAAEREADRRRAEAEKATNEAKKPSEPACAAAESGRKVDRRATGLDAAIAWAKSDGAARPQLENDHDVDLEGTLSNASELAADHRRSFGTPVRVRRHARERQRHRGG